MFRTLTFTTTFISQETRTLVSPFTPKLHSLPRHSHLGELQPLPARTRGETTVVQLTAVSKFESVITLPAKEHTETLLWPSREGRPGGLTEPGGELITSAPIVSSSDRPFPALSTLTTSHESLQSISSHLGGSAMSSVPSGVSSAAASGPPPSMMMTGPSVSPSPGLSGQGEIQHRLSLILPAVIVPTLFLVALGCFVFWKKRKRPRGECVSGVVPFTTSNDASILVHPDQKNHFVRSEQGLVGGMDGRTFKHSNGQRRSVREEGENVTLGIDNDHRCNERSEEIQRVAERESRTRTLDDIAITATRAEIANLQAWLADIEARRVSVPPPEYSSEVGELQEEGVRWERFSGDRWLERA